MKRKIFVVILVFVFSLVPINNAFGQLQSEIVEAYPWEDLQRNHSIIIGINEPEGSLSGDIVVTVIDPATGGQIDSETLTPVWEDIWGKYKVVIASKETPEGQEVNDNLLLDAWPGDEIWIDFGQEHLGPIIVQAIDNPAIVPPGPMWTYGVDLKSSSPAQADRCDQHGGDVDGDAICDFWEDQSANNLEISDPSIQGTYVFDCGTMGCDTSQKDIFVEVDWMDSHHPDWTALKLVQKAFEDQGMRLHIQVDSQPFSDHMQGIYWPGSAQLPGFNQIKGNNFGTHQERTVDYVNNWDEIKKLKFQVFHYAIFAHVNNDDVWETGVGEITGNDFQVTLGKWTGKIGSEDQQSGTFMHELGHNLGLHHGGGEQDQINNKPNLYSVMSYTRQFQDYDPNRVLDYSGLDLGHHHTDHENTLMALDENLLQGWSQGIFTYPGHDDEPIIFSCPDGTVAPLDNYPGKNGGVDWNCNDIKKEPGYCDFDFCNINNFPSAPDSPYGEVLDGHNDWANLKFYFSEHVGNYASGVGTNTSQGLEMDLEKSTWNKIDNHLKLLRAIDQLPENAFAGGLDPPSQVDADGDHYTLGLDCNDNDPKIHPGANDIPNNGIDEDCDGFDSSAIVDVIIPQGTSVPGCEGHDKCYSPYNTIVNVGEEVKWINDDTAVHTVTAGIPSTTKIGSAQPLDLTSKKFLSVFKIIERNGVLYGIDQSGKPAKFIEQINPNIPPYGDGKIINPNGHSGGFDSGILSAGKTFSHTFDTVGTFDYFCLVHPWMTGIVTVQSGVSSGDKMGAMPGVDILNPDLVVPEFILVVGAEPNKESFKDSVKEVIDSINHYNIPQAKERLQALQLELNNSLKSQQNKNKINQIIENIIGTHDAAIGRHTVSAYDMVEEPIIEQAEIEKRIEKIEEFVDSTQAKGLQCGVPTHKVGNECKCPSKWYFDDEGDCKNDFGWYLPPLKQVKMGVEPEDVKCNVGLGLLQFHGDPICITFSTDEAMGNR